MISDLPPKMHFNESAYHATTAVHGDIDKQLERLFRPPASESILLGWRDMLKNSMLAIQEDCCSYGWDGYDAKPISINSLNLMSKLIKYLPEDILMPEISPEPNGNFAIEWYKDRDMQFSVSIIPGDKKNTIIYAGYFGTNNKQYGEQVFGDAIPEPVKTILYKNFPKI